MLTNKKHLLFAQQIVLKKSPVDAYMEVYKNCKTEQAARVNAYKLLRKESINGYIKERQAEIVAKAEEIAVKETANEIKFNYLTVAKKRDILFSIATGKRKVPYFERDGSKRFRYPTNTDVLKAIELDMEISGEGFQPPEPTTAGNTTINGPVYNQVVRKTIFKTRITTARPQNFQTIQDGEGESN